MERTEEQKIIQEPLRVILGGEEYKVKLLVIKESRQWRVKLSALLSSLPKYANVTSDSPDEFGEALNAIMVSMPDTICDLFFDYAKDLNRDEIEEKATEAEVGKAFEQVVEIAFPLVQSMTEAMKKVSQSEQPSSSS